MPAEIHVKEMLLDAVLVSAKNAMVPLASVIKTNAFVTRDVVQSAVAMVSHPITTLEALD